MANNRGDGFHEAQSDFGMTQQVQPRVGQFRRFGEAGPAYEIVRQADSDHVGIRVVYSGEELNYRSDRAFIDPLAETFP